MPAWLLVFPISQVTYEEKEICRWCMLQNSVSNRERRNTVEMSFKGSSLGCDD